MLRKLKDASIRKKLMVINTITTLVTVVFATSAILWVEIVTFRQKMVDDLSTLGGIIGANSTAAVLFNDSAAAKETLSSLKAEPNIRQAVIFLQDGREFARYSLRSAPQYRNASIKELSLSDAVFGTNALKLLHPIRLDGETVGSVFLESDLDELHERQRLYITVSIGVLLASIVVGFIMMARFQRIISRPLSRLADMMIVVGEKKKYSTRVEKDGNDEIGVLIDGFNHMLTQIQQRDEQLENHRGRLKSEISERTKELLIANQELSEAVEKLKEAKDAAEQSSKAKSQFLANMSHELRTPLNHIIGFTELVTDQHFGPLNDDQMDYLNDVLTSSRHLLSLINDILDLSKIEAGKMELASESISPSELFPRSLQMVKESAQKAGIRLETSLDDLPRTLTVDERKIKQVLYNLLSNAVKFTPEGGTVTLSTRMRKCRVDMTSDIPLIAKDDGSTARGNNPETETTEALEIIVADTGVGISTEDTKRIFDQFEQVDGTFGRKYQGTGLGLALTRDLVNLHGGVVWAESEGIGKGARFHVLLPKEPLTAPIN